MNIVKSFLNYRKMSILISIEYLNVYPYLYENIKKAIPLDRSEALNDLWKGSNLEIFQKAGHTLHEEHPEKFNKLAIDFLTE